MGKRVRKLTRRNKIMRKSLRRNSKVSRKSKISRKSKVSRKNKSTKKRRVNRKTLRRYKLGGSQKPGMDEQGEQGMAKHAVPDYLDVIYHMLNNKDNDLTEEQNRITSNNLHDKFLSILNGADPEKRDDETKGEMSDETKGDMRKRSLLRLLVDRPGITDIELYRLTNLK